MLGRVCAKYKRLWIFLRLSVDKKWMDDVQVWLVCGCVLAFGWDWTSSKTFGKVCVSNTPKYLINKVQVQQKTGNPSFRILCLWFDHHRSRVTTLRSTRILSSFAFLVARFLFFHLHPSSTHTHTQSETKNWAERRDLKPWLSRRLAGKHEFPCAAAGSLIELQSDNTHWLKVGQV